LDRVAARNTGLEDCGIEDSVKDLPTASLELMTSVKLHETLPYTYKHNWPCAGQINWAYLTRSVL